jgi:hypothetical protein
MFLQETELASLSADELRQFLLCLIEEISKFANTTEILVAARDAWYRYRAEYRHADPAAPSLPAAHAAQVQLFPGTARPSPTPAHALSPTRMSPVGLAQPYHSPGQRGLKLRLEHACQAQSCDDPACLLCQHNPIRRCTTNLREPPYTYTVDEIIHSPCGATLQVVLVDANGQEVSDVGMLSCSILITLVDDRRYRDLVALPAGPGDMGQVPADVAIDDAILQSSDGVLQLHDHVFRAGAVHDDVLSIHCRMPVPQEVAIPTVGRSH